MNNFHSVPAGVVRMTLMPLIPVIVMCDAATEVQTINSSITKLCDSGTFHNVKANQSRVEGWHVQQLYDCILIIRNRDINTNTVTTMLRIFPVHLSIRSLLFFFSMNLTILLIVVCVYNSPIWEGIIVLTIA